MEIKEIKGCWYIDKAKNDDEANLIALYGEQFDQNGWKLRDSYDYCMTKFANSNYVTGYGSSHIIMLKSKEYTHLSFEEFKLLAFPHLAKEQPKLIKQESNQASEGLTIDNIQKVLLKYIGEEESDDIIKELKTLT